MNIRSGGVAVYDVGMSERKWQRVSLWRMNFRDGGSSVVGDVRLKVRY